MRCRYCGGAARVLSTRQRGDACTVRRMQCEATPHHRFTTLEVYESVANTIGSPWRKAVEMSERGLEMRSGQGYTRSAVCQALQQGKTWTETAQAVGCSRGLVALVAKQMRKHDGA